MANKIVIEEKDDEKAVEALPKEPSRLTHSLKKVADFDFNISNNWIKQQIPFMLFVVFLTLIHIWNVHNTERLVRNTEKLNREVKELRSEYISVFSELMSESKQSSVAKKLDTLGIKELITPPIKISADGQ